MVENSLGRLWVEGHPNDELKSQWKYYLEEAEQEPDVQAQLATIREEYKALKPEDILCIDPCSGSGHILAYMFDVLVQIYEAYGVDTRTAVASIVENNIYGLDIDDRAAQLAYFFVMMKACQYDKRFLRRISGHRRKKACELARLETLKCEVKELTRDEAIIVMVESNLQRSVILPSEKAFAYKMRLEAMNRQAGRPSKDNLTPMVSDLDTTRTNEKLGKEVGESREQIRRYIRLTELVPEIMQMVDERQIAFRPAVEISYLTEEQQYTLLEAMEYNDATPSLAQAIKMKKYNQDGKLTSEVIQSIMEEEKPNQKEKPAFRDERITKLIPKTVPRGQETDFVVKALEFYNRHLQRNKAHER